MNNIMEINIKELKKDWSMKFTREQCKLLDNMVAESKKSCDNYDFIRLSHCVWKTNNILDSYWTGMNSGIFISCYGVYYFLELLKHTLNRKILFNEVVKKLNKSYFK